MSLENMTEGSFLSSTDDSQHVLPHSNSLLREEESIGLIPVFGNCPFFLLLFLGPPSNYSRQSLIALLYHWM